ncbi:22666_t:CDS:2, partial [Racocetra persica]
MAYQISAGQPMAIAISSDDESDYLFETGQHVNDNEQSFDDEQGVSDEQGFNNEQNFDNQQDPSNEQDSDEWDSDPSDEDFQDPENPSTWKFNEQFVTLNSEEFTEEVEKIEKSLLIKLGKAKSEIVNKIKYRLEFEEYPETSENGVACVYNVAGMDTEKALEIFDLKNIQYAYKDGTTRESVYCPFLKTKVYKETRTCRGIKICQFAAPELVAMTHTS